MISFSFLKAASTLLFLSLSSITFVYRNHNPVTVATLIKESA